MEKKLRLGFVGSHVRMELIRKIIPSSFPEIQTELYENDRYDYCEEMERALLALKRRVDGVIFGGELQFKLYQNIFEPDTPCTFIQKDSVSLLNSFLFLAWRKVDISRVSVDNYSASTIRKILSDAEITDSNIKILRRRKLGTANKKYYEDLYQEHRALYREGAVDGCITTLFFVHDRLAAEGIPVAYSRPTTDNITKTVARLKRECLERIHMTEGNLAVLALRITPREDIFYQSQSEYFGGHEKLKAAEELYYFAKDARATVIQQSDEQFVLLINRVDLMNYSNGLESLPFLHLIRDNCKCSVSLGIGFGYTPGEARSNASLALKKAAQYEGSCTYIVHNIHSILGPVNFITPQSTQNPEVQEQLQLLSQNTGISVSKLYRINQLRERTKKSLFTAVELAEQLNLSPRSAGRLVNALEAHGLIRLSGQTVSEKAGRPRNIYQILFELEQ